MSGSLWNLFPVRDFDWAKCPYSTLLTLTTMIELLLASVIIGTTEITPNVLQVEYLTPNNQIVTVLDNVELKGNSNLIDVD